MADESKVRLTEGLLRNDVLAECLERVSSLALPDWYLGAGCISQTIWNIAHGNPPSAHILDYDLVYYDPDQSREKERVIEDKVRQILIDLPIEVDVKNQARVHRWYPDRFGYNIPPYGSMEEAIATWPTTATSVGVRLTKGTFEVFAPFGTRDLLNQVVRANRVQVTREIFEMKAARWKATWPHLKVVPWELGIGTEGARHLGPARKVNPNVR